MSDETPNPLEGLLSEFALGPSWARAKSDTPSSKTHERAEREYQPRRTEGREDRSGGGGRRDDRRDSRDSRDGGGGRMQGGGGNRRDNRNDRVRPERVFEEIAPAEGVNVTLFPEKGAIQLVCKEVHQVARVYPLFDIAEIILAERARSRAVFEINEKKPGFLRCKIEDAVFLTREEALRFMLAADWRHRFIEESTVEIDPPKGNFQSVAMCGISGEWLGPPNYHEYQTNLRRIHRERFAHMPFEAYSAKVRTERSEEAVNEWLDSMKNQTRWRILSDEEIAARQAAAAAPPAEPVVDTTHETNESNDETAASSELVSEPPTSEAPPEEPSAPAEEPTAEVTEEAPEEAVSEELSEADSEAETPGNEPPSDAPTKDEPTWFTDRAEFERALATEVLDRAFQTTRKAKVSAAIPGRSLSPGLLVRLKGTGNHHKKHPAIMIPVICKALEGEHMPVFKRKGKLFTGPARPHALAADAVLAPRPAEMVKWIRENTPAKLEGLWKAVLPEGSTAPPAEYAADLFWLLQQGHILLYTDDTLVVQEAPKPQEPKKPKQPKIKAEKVPSENPAASLAEPAASVEETPAVESPDTKSVLVEEAAEPAGITTDAINDIAETASDLIDTATEATKIPTIPAGPPSEVSPHPEPSSHNSPDKPEASTPIPPAEPAEPVEPLEIITDAIKSIAETISEAASDLIDTAIKATEPESKEKRDPDSSTDHF